MRNCRDPFRDCPATFGIARSVEWSLIPVPVDRRRFLEMPGAKIFTASAKTWIKPALSVLYLVNGDFETSGEGEPNGARGECGLNALSRAAF